MKDKDRDTRDRDSVTRGEAGNPKGVGKSTSHRGEDVSKGGTEVGRKDLGTKGKTDRPVGSSTARDSTGVDPKDPINPSSPNLNRGGG
jgi:hypothetical protein